MAVTDMFTFTLTVALDNKSKRFCYHLRDRLMQLHQLDFINDAASIPNMKKYRCHFILIPFPSGFAPFRSASDRS